MSGLELYSILLSESEATKEGAEGVYATISNDYAKSADGKPILGQEYGYRIWGVQLHGPIPAEPRGGFTNAKDAEDAAKQEYKNWRSGKIPGRNKDEAPSGMAHSIPIKQIGGPIVKQLSTLSFDKLYP
jgi:hypothetical protein